MFVLYRIERTSIRYVTLRFLALIGYVRTVPDNFCAGTLTTPDRVSFTHIQGAVSRNSAKLGNYKMPVKLRET